RDAQLDAELADRTHDQAKWNFAPSLNAGATHGYNWGKTIDRYTNSFATDRVRTNNFWLGTDLSLYQGGSKLNTLRQSMIAEEAALKGLAAARNTVRTTVVQGFLNVLGLRERVTAAEVRVASSRDQVTRMEALVEAGRSARTELLDLNAQLASDEYNLVNAGNAVDQALLQLAQALLLEPAEAAAFDIESPSIGTLVPTGPVATEEEVLRNVLANNPAYAQAELNTRSAERGMSIARAGMLPTLSLSASLGTGYSGRNSETVGEPTVSQSPIGYTQDGEIVYTPDYSYDTRTRPFGKQVDDNLNESVSLSLNVPIFNQKQNSLAMDRARIQHEQAKNRMESTRQQLQRDVQNALITQRNAFRQYESARRSLDASETALAAAQDRFDAGTITAIEMSTARVRQQQAITDLINAKYNYLLARGSLDILQGLPISF
ncbi:MAG TPA: TolC family protein, partial [Flavobacteriales bacterium]|nr:TolC family protein [Flavobacteriales bacterium]